MIQRELIKPGHSDVTILSETARSLRPAFVLLLIFTVITGVAYPLLVTGIAKTAFPAQAEGSLLRRGDTIVGSRLLGQEFSDPKYFWGRLSATGPTPYNAASSSGSNYGPLSSSLMDAAKSRVEEIHAAEATVGLTPTSTTIPQDLLTASGSGLDPHISPAAAEFQVPRVSRARALDETTVRRLVKEHTEGRQFGFLGEPRVNVLLLNIDLNELSQNRRQ